MLSNKRKSLSLAERVDVVKRLEAQESQSSVAKCFGVHPSAISRITKNKQQILTDWQNNNNPDRKRKRTGKEDDVEEALLRWFSQARSRQVPVSGPLLMEKANSLAEGLGVMEFKATVGWLERWKERNGIKFKKQHGEKQDADDWGAERWVTEILPGILQAYSPRDIFNADETGLYWRAMPDGTLSFKNAEASGCKVPKERVTLLLACNMDGTEKLEPLTIGKSKQPRCFKNVKRLPVAYEANKNAWMTSDIWEEWLKKLDTHRSHRTPRHSFSQWIGIIANFKQHYRSLVLRHLMGMMELAEGRERAAEFARKLTLLDSLHMQKAAWSRVTAATVIHCYRRASFTTTVDDETESVEASDDETAAVEPPAGITAEDFDRYVSVDSDIQTAAAITDEELCAGTG